MLIEKNGEPVTILKHMGNLIVYQRDGEDRRRSYTKSEFSANILVDTSGPETNQNGLGLRLGCRTLAQATFRAGIKADDVIDVMSFKSLLDFVNDLAEFTYGEEELHIDSILFAGTNSRVQSGITLTDEVIITCGVKVLTYSLLDFAELMLHEFAHLRNAQSRTADTCGNGNYHNGVFLAEARGAGLVCVETTRGLGYGHTKMSDTTKASICNRYDGLHKPVSSLPATVEDSGGEDNEAKMAKVREAKRSMAVELEVIKHQMTELRRELLKISEKLRSFTDMK